MPSDYGCGANDGAYYPVGLLTLGTYLKRKNSKYNITIVDLHHEKNYRPQADVVGISANSVLNYRNVLAVAEKAKEQGASVILGGPYATRKAEDILRNRANTVDFIIRGYGEVALDCLLETLNNGGGLGNVPNLSWRNKDGIVIHNEVSVIDWNYDKFLPLDFSLLRSGIEAYHKLSKGKNSKPTDATFVIFTHFGCSYQDMVKKRKLNKSSIAHWCSYCSLDGGVSSRKGKDIVEEVLGMLHTSKVPKESNVLLKCYGDNAGKQEEMLNDLACEIEACNKWKEYNIEWTFYMQSCFLLEKTAKILRRIGTRNLFIGFDSADNRIQKLNALGTSLQTHKRAIRICKENGIRIQAGFVLGCAGETQESIDNTLAFANELALSTTLDRINAAVVVIIPGAPNYSLLCEKEPWLIKQDLMDIEEVRWNWVRHFCPDLGKTPSGGLRILEDAANYLDDLSPGQHASMGFLSKRFKENEMVKPF